MNKYDWLQYGLDHGYCGPAVCLTHDGTPMTEDEDKEFCDGDDPCIFVFRSYEDSEHRKAVEDYHSPSVWRK